MSRVPFGLSIIIPNYNYGHLITKAIDSVFKQKFNSDSNHFIEVIVVDDKSTDNSLTTLKQLQKQHKQLHVYQNEQNQGPAFCRNFAITKSKYDYLLFLDADDILTNDSIDTIIQCIKNNNYPNVLISDHYNLNIDIDIDTKDYKNNSKSLATTNCLATTSYMPRFMRGIQQTWFFTRFLNLAAKSKSIDINSQQSLVTNAGVFKNNLSSKDLLINYLLTKKLSITAGSIIIHRTVFNHIQFYEQLRQNEDLPVFAYCIANYKCHYLNHATVIVHKHQGSLRNQHQLLNEQNNVVLLTDLIFQKAHMPPELLYLKRFYLSQRYLSLFRSYYLAKQYNSARIFYKKALKKNFLSILKINYLRKYIMTLLPTLQTKR